jgi:pimeloyl-ACP methyl ester carboxylesterase
MLRRFRKKESSSVSRPTGSITRSHGVDLHWIEAGSSRDGEPPLVLLHGLGDSHRTWREVMPQLAKSRRVIMPDLAGHGLSTRPDASYSLDWHARVIGAWLGALNLDRIDLVGHSFGGGIAQWLLLEHAHRIRRLALVAAGGLGREVALPLRLAALPHLLERVGQPFMAPGTFLALNAAPALSGAYSFGEVARLSWMNSTRGSARAFARTVRDVIDLGGQRRGFFQRAHEIPKLPPMRLFWGEDDPVIPLQHAITAAPLIEGASFRCFSDCGHYPHKEQPVRFAAALESFLRGDDEEVDPDSLITDDEAAALTG